MSRLDRLPITAIVLLAICLGGSCDRDRAPAESAAAVTADSSATDRQIPLPARDVVAKAVSQARAEKKAVLIEFGASWCTWCTNFQNFVQSPDAGTVIADNFIVETLVVREDVDKKPLEHPGGSELMAEWGGAEAGLPFYVFLDADGNKVGDSNAMPDGGNIGYPVTAIEIEQFMGVLDETAPRLTAEGRIAVQAYLERAAATQP